MAASLLRMEKRPACWARSAAAARVSATRYGLRMASMMPQQGSGEVLTWRRWNGGTPGVRDGEPVSGNWVRSVVFLVFLGVRLLSKQVQVVEGTGLEAMEPSFDAGEIV